MTTLFYSALAAIVLGLLGIFVLFVVVVLGLACLYRDEINAMLAYVLGEHNE